MQLPQPYLFTSPRMVALVDRAQMVPAEGPIADSIYGYHTFWAAEVPFIPAHVSKDDRDFDTEATNRIARAVQRQVRFHARFLFLIPSFPSANNLKQAVRKHIPSSNGMNPFLLNG